MLLGNMSIEKFSRCLKERAEAFHIYLACAGNYGKLIGNYLNSQRIRWTGYLDNDRKLSGKDLNGKKIVHPEDIVIDASIVVVICNVFLYDDLHRQFLHIGIKENNILGFQNRRVFDEAIYLLKEPAHYLKRLRSLKGIKEGERCFLIGGGPSLRLEDLNRLAEENTMATNTIFMGFPMTCWRPSCYFVQDMSMAEKYFSTEEKLRKMAKECEYLLCSVKNCIYDLRDSDISNLFFYYLLDNSYDEMPEFSEEISDRLYYASTTIYSMYQMAAYMGFKEIYLIGMDMGFVNEKLLDGRTVRRGNYNNEAEFMKTANLTGIYETERILLGHMAAKKYAESHGIKIYNATRGGKLEIFERVSFDALF